MSTMDASEIASTFYLSAEARDWATFASLLADDVVYELPQTHERIRGRDTYVRFNQEYPGDWHLEIIRCVGEGRHAAIWTHFRVGGDEMPGLTFFDFDESGRIAKVTDFWPEPYPAPSDRAHLVERY